MTSHALGTEQLHKLRVRGANGGKLQTSLVIATVLERTDKGTATKLMKKRAKSFSKKDFKRSLCKARSSLTQFKDKTKETFSSHPQLNTVSKSDSNSSLQNSGEVASATDASSSFEETSNLKQLTNGELEPAKYRIAIQVNECGNLCGKGSKQLFDTYVKLKVGELENKTRVYKKSSNPKFNESFEFDLHDLMEPLRIRVCLNNIRLCFVFTKMLT